jgi:hypothetical protein
MSLLQQYLDSEVIFRLRQEGYVLLLVLLFVFTVSIIVTNVLALFLSGSIRLWSYIETAELRPLRKRAATVSPKNSQSSVDIQ